MDSQSGEQVRTALDQLLDENQDHDLEIHSGGLGYLSTMSFAHILHIARRVRDGGRELTFVDLPPQLQSLFEKLNESGLIRIRPMSPGCK